MVAGAGGPRSCGVPTVAVHKNRSFRSDGKARGGDEYVLDCLAAQGVERAVVKRPPFADRSSAISPAASGPKIIISDESGELLGTAGGLDKALPKIGDGPVPFHVNSTPSGSTA